MKFLFYSLAGLCICAGGFTVLGLSDENKIDPNSRWYDPDYPVDIAKRNVSWSKKATVIVYGLAVIFFLFGIAAPF